MFNYVLWFWPVFCLTSREADKNGDRNLSTAWTILSLSYIHPTLSFFLHIALCRIFPFVYLQDISDVLFYIWPTKWILHKTVTFGSFHDICCWQANLRAFSPLSYGGKPSTLMTLDSYIAFINPSSAISKGIKFLTRNNLYVTIYHLPSYSLVFTLCFAPAAKTMYLRSLGLR